LLLLLPEDFFPEDLFPLPEEELLLVLELETTAFVLRLPPEPAE